MHKDSKFHQDILLFKQFWYACLAEQQEYFPNFKNNISFGEILLILYRATIFRGRLSFSTLVLLVQLSLKVDHLSRETMYTASQSFPVDRPFMM